MEASCSVNGVNNALSKPANGATVPYTKKQTANGIIVPALSDSALRTVPNVIRDPVKMVERLDAFFDSQSTVTNISQITELASLSYRKGKDDITKHIDRMAALMGQIKSMKTIVDDAVQIGVFIVPIEVSELSSVTAAINNCAEKDISLETVTDRLIT